MVYASVMLHTLEERVGNLEREFAQLRSQVLGLGHREKNWRSTVGMFEPDDMTKEADRLGREYREEQTYEKEIAGS